MSKEITQKRLHELFDYNPDTGIFTRKIKLGKRSLVGEVVGNKKSNGYLRTGIDEKDYHMHRLAWLYVHGKFPVDQTDHINGIRTDNRICNLRAVSHRENGKNQKRPPRNKSGIVGVNWKKENNKWIAQIMVNKINIYLGLYSDKFDAICARKSAEHKYGFHINHGRV